MDSSTSSSKSRLPQKPFLGIWLGIALVAVTGISLLETLARISGVPAMPADDWGLWALERSKVREDDPNQVVLLGSSRMQVGLDPEAFAQSLGTPSVLQLAILGGTPIPILEDLANHTDFQGIAVCDFFPAGYFIKNPRETRTLPKSYAERYQFRARWALLERTLKLVLEESFSSVNAGFHPVHTLRKWLRDGEFPPQWRVLQSNRAWKVDYSQWRPEWFIKETAEENRPIPMEPAEVLKAALEIEEIVTRIRERGGEVVFVRFPVAHDYLRTETADFPRQKFWDPWADQTSALTLHFEDYPETIGFVPEDGSHLGEADSIEFGKALGEIVRRELKNRGRILP